MNEGERVAQTAAQFAIDRVRDALQEGRQPHAHLFDALDGVYRLEEMRRRQSGPEYYGVRDSVPDGQVVGGLVYVRGLATHQTILASTFIDLFPSETLYPGPDVFPGRTWRWKAFESLPPPAKLERWGRDTMYQEHVERRDLLVTLETAWSFLAPGGADVAR